MDQGCADLVRFGSDPADDKGRDTVTDINADDNGKHAAEIQSHRTGQGLQDTDDRRRALDNTGDNNARKESQEVIVLKGCQQDTEHIAHITDGRAHIDESHEQDAESDADGTQGIHPVPFQEHDADNSQDQRHGRQVIRLEKIEETACAGIQVHQTDDLGCNGRTYVGAQNNTDRLPEGQEPRSDQTDCQYDGRCRGLDHACDQHTEQESQCRFGGNAGQCLFHSAAGGAFQSVAHQAHSVKEHGQPAQKRDHFIKYIHVFFLLLKKNPVGLRARRSASL